MKLCVVKVLSMPECRVSEIFKFYLITSISFYFKFKFKLARHVSSSCTADMDRDCQAEVTLEECLPFTKACSNVCSLTTMLVAQTFAAKTSRTSETGASTPTWLPTETASWWKQDEMNCGDWQSVSSEFFQQFCQILTTVLCFCSAPLTDREQSTVWSRSAKDCLEKLPLKILCSNRWPIPIFWWE